VRGSGQRDAHGDPEAEDRTEAATRRWRDAENRLYPIVMVRPDLYERSITLVRETVDELRDVTTVEELVAADTGSEGLIVRILRRRGLPADELDLGLIAGAAFAVRHAELGATAARARSTARIAAARERGDEWVLLHETQQRMAGAAPTPPYHRLEMRLADGLGLHLYVSPDPSTARPVYGLETVLLDAETGEWLGDAPSPVSATYAAVRPWDAHSRALRRGRGQGVPG
jgi:hypothetical protein